MTAFSLSRNSLWLSFSFLFQISEVFGVLQAAFLPLSIFYETLSFHYFSQMPNKHLFFVLIPSPITFKALSNIVKDDILFHFYNYYFSGKIIFEMYIETVAIILSQVSDDESTKLDIYSYLRQLLHIYRQSLAMYCLIEVLCRFHLIVPSLFLWL